MKSISLISFSFLLASTCHAFGVGQTDRSAVKTAAQLDRSNFLAIMAAGVTASMFGVSPASAKEENEALKGTKKDPTFEACLSQCIYDCTKPKGAEQKSRKECLPECKQQCATSKNQLLRGDPKSD